MKMLALLIAVGCSSSPGSTTFTVRSKIDPAHPLTVDIAAPIPKEWPQPTLDKLGEPTFTFERGIPAMKISMTESHGADAHARIEEIDKDQLFPASVQRSDFTDGRRWIVQRENEADGDVIDAWLLIPGPRDAVVVCYLRAMPMARLYTIARGVCEDLRLTERSP